MEVENIPQQSQVAVSKKLQLKKHYWYGLLIVYGYKGKFVNP